VFLDDWLAFAATGANRVAATVTKAIPLAMFIDADTSYVFFCSISQAKPRSNWFPISLARLLVRQRTGAIRGFWLPRTTTDLVVVMPMMVMTIIALASCALLALVMAVLLIAISAVARCRRADCRDGLIVGDESVTCDGRTADCGVTPVVLRFLARIGHA